MTMTEESRERALLVGVDIGEEVDFERSMEELKSLAEGIFLLPHRKVFPVIRDFSSIKPPQDLQVSEELEKADFLFLPNMVRG